VVFRVFGRLRLDRLGSRLTVLPIVVIGVLACFALASATYAQILGAPPSFKVGCLRCAAK
jgi:hypothetical protein